MEVGKIFVGGLDWETQAEGLKNHFSSYGEVTDCVVMKNPEGRSRGFGFVTFSDPETVNATLSKKHTIDGRMVDAKPCSARGPNGASKGGSQRPTFTGKTTKIFMGGLPNDGDEDNLKAFFSKYGTVVDVVVIRDESRTRSRGFGYLTFEKEEAVEDAVKDHYVEFLGKKVEVKRAEPKQAGQRRNYNSFGGGNDQGWGDSSWKNSNQGGGYQSQGQGYGGGYGSYGWNGGQQQWGGNQDYYNQSGYGGYGNSQGYDSSAQAYGSGSYGGSQGYSGNQGYSSGSQGGYGGSGAQGYSGSQGGYGGGSQGYGGQQGGYSSGSQEGGYSGGKSSGGGGGGNSGGGSQGYHPYKR